MPGPRVAVVIITYNSRAVIDRLLDGLPAALTTLDHEVVVIDNSSADGTAAHVAARGDCRVIERPNLGFAAGINAGVGASDAEFVLALNPDLTVEADAVTELLQAMTSPKVGIAAPRVLDADGELTWSMRREPTIRRATGLSFTGLAAYSEYVTDPAAYANPQVVDWALGAALLFRRSVFDELAGWDESFFLYSEETDFCLRARDRGWQTVYQPTAVVAHDGGGSGTSPRIHSMQILNRVRLYRRRHGALAGAVYWAIAVGSEIKWSLRGNSSSRTAVRMLLRPRSRPAELGPGVLRVVPV